MKRHSQTLWGIVLTAATALGLSAPAAGQPNAYFPNQVPSRSEVVDTATQTVTASIPLPSTYCHAEALPNGTEIYFAADQGDSVMVVDTATQSHVASIPVPFSTNASTGRGMAASPDSSQVFVPDFDDDTVSVIDTATHSVVDTFAVDPGPGVAVLHPDGNTLYLLHLLAGSVSVVDVASRATLATIPVGAFPLGAEMLPDGSALYVVNHLTTDISVIDTATSTVSSTIALPHKAFWAAAHPDGTRLYTANFEAPFVDEISVIDTATNTVIANIDLPGDFQTPVGAQVTPDGSQLYVPHSGAVSIIDTATLTIVNSVPLPDLICGMGHFIAPEPVVEETAGGSMSGLDPRRVRCANLTELQSVVPPLNGSSWDCEAAGLEVESGDWLAMRANGKADGSGPVGGEATGMELRWRVCVNRSTWQVGFGTATGDTWTCDDLIRIRRGHRIRMTVFGRAE